MRVRTLRSASLGVFGTLLPALLVVNLFLGNTLASFGLFVLLVGLLCTGIGVFLWVVCGLVERYTAFTPFGLYLIYGGLSFTLLAVICIVLIPVIHALGPAWVFPDRG